MILSMNYQAKLFILMIIIGFSSGFFYDVLRIIRRTVKHNNIIMNIEDILYWAGVTFAVFYIMLIKNNGEVRFYVIIGILIGMILYFLTISTYVLKVSMTVINFFKKVIAAILKILLFPFKILLKILKPPMKWILSIFKKCSTNTGKRLQKCGNYAKMKSRRIKKDIKVIFKKI